MELLTILEYTAVIFGIINVYLLTKQKILAWPAGLITVSIYVFIFLNARLYSDMILHLVYIVLNAYGWWYWSRSGSLSENTKEIPVTLLTSKQRVTWGVIIVIATIIWGFLMDRNTDADFAFFDAFTTSGSLVAQYLLARKKIENWIIWIIVDVVAVNIYILKGLYPTAFLFTVFLILCIIGWISWKKSSKAFYIADN